MCWLDNLYNHGVPVQTLKETVQVIGKDRNSFCFVIVQFLSLADEGHIVTKRIKLTYRRLKCHQ